VKHKGLFNLQTSRDLLDKAEHDFKRLKADPVSAYAAFDFFVAVRHLPDWLHPRDEDKSKALFDKHIELRIARHIADLTKHFEVTFKHHKQVAGTSAVVSVLQSSPPQAVSKIKQLIIKLDPKDPDIATIDKEITVLQLAERILGVARNIVN
jgi:hypothetical protein